MLQVAGKIFLVDTCSHLRSLAKGMLEARGYRVTAQAGSVEEADKVISQFQRCPKEKIPHLMPNIAIISTNLGRNSDDGLQVDALLATKLTHVDVYRFAWVAADEKESHGWAHDYIRKRMTDKESAAQLAATIAEDPTVGISKNTHTDYEYFASRELSY
jgi:hypothetical protein